MEDGLNSIRISVITCSHEPRTDYLSRVLLALEAQTLDKETWEFILVDSASHEPLADRIDLSWHLNARHSREDSGGLTRARLRGIAEAKADLLVFVDDDNVLDSDFLSQALRLSQEWPTIGAWSGHTRPGFERTPAEWTRRYWGNLVIREVERDAWSNQPMLPETMPCGAGLCVRRGVARRYADLHASGQRSIMLDRVGKSLLSGGDNDLAACSCQIGLGVGVFAALRLTHLIPPARLEEEYLVSLTEGIYLSHVILRSVHGDAQASRPPGATTLIADAIRLLFLNRRERRFLRAVRRGERRGREYLATNAMATR